MAIFPIPWHKRVIALIFNDLPIRVNPKAQSYHLIRFMADL
jgi:hypothetical protein